MASGALPVFPVALLSKVCQFFLTLAFLGFVTPPFTGDPNKEYNEEE